jgi:DNA-binding MarR family transcriptional regulator
MSRLRASGPMRLAALAESIGADANVLARSVRALERANMVTRDHSVVERRLCTMVTLTPTGAQAIGAFVSAIVAMLAEPANT